jgi:hypothetical protein
MPRPIASGPPLWVYGYHIALLGREPRLAAVRSVIARENRTARHAAGAWTARLVRTRHGTQVLIVSTRPDRDSMSNRRLEAELTCLGFEFLVTGPMKVVAEPALDEG